MLKKSKALTTDLVFRLTERARIRRQIATRKSVQEGKPDRISDVLEEAALEITTLRGLINKVNLCPNTGMYTKTMNREIMAAIKTLATQEGTDA